MHRRISSIGNRQPSATPLFKPSAAVTGFVGAILKIESGGGDGEVKQSAVDYMGDADIHDPQFALDCYKYVMIQKRDLAFKGVQLLREVGGLTLEPSQQAVHGLGGETVFGIAWELYKQGQHEAHEILKYLAHHSSSQWIYMQIKTLTFQENWNNIQDLEEVCQSLISGSSLPLTMALMVSNLCRRLALKYVSLEDQYLELRDKFTRIAIAMVNDVETDFLAMLILEKPDALGRTALQIALKSKNSLFTSSERVASVLDRIWHSSRFMVRDDDRKWTKLLRRYPRDLFLLPSFKFALKSGSYILFVLILVAISGINAYGNSFRAGLFIFGKYFSLLYFLDEVLMLFEVGALSYLRRFNNVIACPVYLFTIILFDVLLQNQGRLHVHGWMSILPLFILLRLFHVLKINTKFGALLLIFNDVMGQIVQLLLFLFLTWLGFVFSFLLLFAGQDIPGFDSFFSISTNLYSAMLGNFDLSALAAIEGPDAIWIQVLFLGYVFFTMVILLNMMIAIMSNAFTNGYDQSIQTYYFGLAQIICDFDSDFCSTHAPFSSFVYPTFIIRAFYGMLRGKKRYSFSDGNDLQWKCPRCHMVNSADGKLSRESLMDRLAEIRKRDTHKSDETLITYAERVLYPDDESCAELCRGCLRVSKNQSQLWQRLRREREELAYWVFLVTIYPAFLLGWFIASSIMSFARKIFIILKDQDANHGAAKKSLVLEAIFKRKERDPETKAQISKWVNDACANKDVELTHIDKKLDKLILGFDLKANPMLIKNKSY
jgi:hypothetical protein